MAIALVTRGKRLFILPVLLATMFGFHWFIRGIAPAGAQNDLPAIMFVTQPPFGADFISVNAVFGNHLPRTQLAPRGGDLWIRYSDGALRNLTQEAGLGTKAGEEIIVREPSMHWSGVKALVAIASGGTTKDDYSAVFYQLYEVTGFGKGEAVKFTRLPQPADNNNVSPLYGTDDRIIFTSDRPRNGDKASYPQLDEYESQATNTGIWSMNSDGSDVRLLDHAVSGDFTPSIAADGRLVFTRWDHLQRDQQNEYDPDVYKPFNFTSENSDEKLSSAPEVFPEPLRVPSGSYNHRHTINQFFPWQMNEDGTELETLNHIGRHELLSYFDASHDGLPEFIAAETRRTSASFLQIKEDPLRPGYFIGTNAPEFATHAAGQIIALNAPKTANAEQMQFEYLTDPVTRSYVADAQQPPLNHVGLFRNPTPLSTGTLIAVHTTSTYADKTAGQPLSSRYNFRLVRMTRPAQGGGYWLPGERLLPNGINKTITYWDNQTYTQLNFSGQLWELDPVEIRVRPRPAKLQTPLPEIEANILQQELGGQAGIDQFKTFLEARNLALVVSRNVTRRADKQQDYNLRVVGGVQTAEANATPVDVQYIQFLQGDLVRGYNGYTRGRRPIAQIQHDSPLPNVPNAPFGSVQVASDGSIAAFVPARRALSWQLTKPNGEGVVRERYWLTFQPGEMRSCTNCHGLNTTDVVLHQPAPTNPPQALRDLLRWYRTAFPTPVKRAAHLSAASYSEALLAAESIVAAFGGNLANTTASATAALPTTLGGTSVKVKDSLGVERAAPLFFVSPTQVNYQIPAGTARGLATITITNASGETSLSTAQIGTTAPGLFTANATGKGLAAAVALRVKADGSQSYEAIGQFDAQQNRFVPRPIDLGAASDQVYLVMFGSGWRARAALDNVEVKVGGVNAPVNFAAAQGGLIGVDQLNARLPRALLGRGEVEITVLVDGKAANVVRVSIK
ncbi:MAG: hypothetical protein HYR56_24305 [Acidobacteria bacterium]|nr:hypothetical protein [Acidobacteriota bacterium]MBI3423408.1 hypothetical protein [Acidobacteriota bacterium]